MTAPRVLRPYQTDAICGARGSVAAGNRWVLLQLPTAAGKTVIAAEIIRTARAKGTRCCFAVPMTSLVDQTVQRFFEHGLSDIGVMQADHPMTDPSKPIQVATVQTLARRQKPDVGLVIIDEAHRQDRQLMKWLKSPEMTGVIVIGLSATPWAKGMAKDWDDLIICSTTKDMIAAGYLSPYRVFAPSHPDLSGVRTKMGDFNETDLAEAMNKPSLVADVVETWLTRAENRPTLVFAVDRAHAKSLQDRFEEVGIPCGYVDCNSTPEDRKSVEKKFQSGEYPVVASVGTLTTGVDWDVRCIVLARPTKSEMLYCQIVGRGLRLAPGKVDCLILDHSDTTQRLGFVDDIHYTELNDGAKRGPSSGDKAKPLPKECPKCQFLRPAKVSKCPSCGFQPEMTSKLVIAEGSLDEVTRGKSKKRGAQIGTVTVGGNVMSQQKFFLMLSHIAQERGYSSGWSSNQYRAMTGVYPPFSWRDLLPIRADIAVKQWVKSRQIAYAKRREAERAHV